MFNIITGTRNYSWMREDRSTDWGLYGGAALCVALIAIGVFSGPNGLNFLSPASLLIVLGGTFGAALIHFSSADLRAAWKSLSLLTKKEPVDPAERLEYIVRLAQLVRQNGLLVLEREARYEEDTFLRRALELAVDGQDPEDVRRTLETELNSGHREQSRAVSVFEVMGQYAPAMGLIGTLIGLIQMLGSLDNPETVGPAMAIALVTTLYGAVLANLIFLPLAGKIRNRNEDEGIIRAITIEGAVNLRQEENPVVIEQRLRSFLPRISEA